MEAKELGGLVEGLRAKRAVLVVKIERKKKGRKREERRKILIALFLPPIIRSFSPILTFPLHTASCFANDSASGNSSVLHFRQRCVHVLLYIASKFSFDELRKGSEREFRS